MKKTLLLVLKPVAYFIGIMMKTFNIKSNIEGFKIIFPKEMKNWERGSIWGQYEGHERLLVKKYLRPEDSVLEMGACLGVVSLTINRILSDKYKQVSVEPNPDVLTYLVENKKNNNGKFFIESSIVTNKKEVTFHKGGAAFLGSSLLGNGESVAVKGISFEKLEEKYFPFSAIIMDIEGAELQFFQLLKSHNSHINTIIWESHPHILTNEELEKCYILLKESGFKYRESSAEVQAWTK